MRSPYRARPHCAFFHNPPGNTKISPGNPFLGWVFLAKNGVPRGAEGRVKDIPPLGEAFTWETG